MANIVSVRRLAWSDPDLGSIPMPKRPMRVRAGFGSALAVRDGEPAGTVWALCDRGPNLKADTASELYGLELGLAGKNGAKIMPRLDLGPSIAELRVGEDAVELVRVIRLTDGQGCGVPGVPMAASAHAVAEPAFDLSGERLQPQPGGADSEGLTALLDGGFWVGDEYGPSLLKVDAEGRVVLRWVAQGAPVELESGYPVLQILPPLAGRRQINRGFEALALSADERWLYLAFQSPLAHPDEEAHEGGSHVRIWQIDASSGLVASQFIYPLDPPESFRRDCAKGKFGRSDIKVSEIACAGEGALLVLERGSETTKIYRVRLEPKLAAPLEHLDVATRPTLEELSAGDSFALPVLSKTLLLNTDDHPQMASDQEGMALLSPSELLLVNDNDFGMEGAETSFWRIAFDAPLTRD
jgi:hypothetical protein